LDKAARCEHPRQCAVRHAAKSDALAASIASTWQPARAAAPAGALFVSSTSSTTGPSLRIDRDGGMHLAAVASSMGIDPVDDPRLPAYYAYCAAGLDCRQPGSWGAVALGEHLQMVQLELTPEGHPRLLLQTAVYPPAGRGQVSLWYAECDSLCTDVANWALIDIVDTRYTDDDFFERPKHSFALDPLGRPRCTEVTTDPESGATVTVNWSDTVLARELYG
jgi:hypothetical protein